MPRRPTRSRARTTRGAAGPSIWDTFSHSPGLSHHGDTGDIACDHYHRWQADFDLMAELGARNYRFSLSWSRLQPSGRGPLNPVAVAFYRAQLEGLRDRGIRPFVTLYHWDLPQPLQDAGGWPERETADLFGAYVRLVGAEFADLVADWITLNEPWCASFLGYGVGAHAPGLRDLRASTRAAHHLNLAHGLALAALREVAPGGAVGVTNIITEIGPATDSAEDLAAAARLDATSNLVFLEPVLTGAYSGQVHGVLDAYGLADAIRDGDLALISAPLDFVGVNHYQRVIASHDDTARAFSVRETPAEPATTSFGWSVIPDSLEAVLLRISRDFTSLPLYVTESGASYHDYVDPEGRVHDPERVEYLAGYFAAAARAIAAGVNLRGYFVWSFLDNFEWAEGYDKRFGAVYVDYRTQERIPKTSARWYASLLQR